MSTATTPLGASAGIDPRGPRVAAGVTSVVLGLVLVTPQPVAGVLLAVQAVVFGVGAVRGVQHTPYAALFRRGGPPRPRAPPHPPGPPPPPLPPAGRPAVPGRGAVGL